MGQAGGCAGSSLEASPAQRRRRQTQSNDNHTASAVTSTARILSRTYHVTSVCSKFALSTILGSQSGDHDYSKPKLEPMERLGGGDELKRRE